jgi:hypothetical protein
MSESLGAWHGSQELKDRIVDRMKSHRDADAIVQADYQRIDPTAALGYRGCAIGCALDLQPAVSLGYGVAPARGWHGQFEHEFGIPEDVARQIDDCFESFDDKAEARDFAVQVLEAIPVGANLNDVTEAYMVSYKEAGGEVPDDLLRLLTDAPMVEARREAASDE